MNLATRMAAPLVALLLVTVVFQTAVVKAYEDGDGSGPRVSPLEEIPGPFRELDKLVAGLIAATTDLTDTDEDGLPDTVEAVIGTDPRDRDSDADSIPDMAEVANRTDPKSPDSNKDGLADGVEVVDGDMDVDLDGTPNAWDPDNDGDGLRDARDLSPFAATATGWSHHIDVSAGGRATTISLQLRTEDPDTMRLVRQTWDWPYDTEGAMRDLDNSTEDVTAVPVLQLEGEGLPVDDELGQYGIVVAGEVAYVPLYPIDDMGDMVALQAQMFLPANDTPQDISLDAKLKWKVTGSSDTAVASFRAHNGMFLSLGQGDYIWSSASSTGEKERFELVDLRDGKYALRASNGKYLSSTWGSAISATGTNITDNTIIKMEPRGDGKFSMAMELYEEEGATEPTMSFLLGIGPNGVLQAAYEGYRGVFGFEWVDQGVTVERVPLAVYADRFALTGLYVQEEFGTDVALVYRNDSMEKAVAANMYLAYQFLRNATNGATDIPRLMESADANVGVIVASYERMDLAVRALAESLTAAAKAGFPEGALLPVITAVQQRYASLDLASQGQGRVGAGGGMSFDVSSQPLVVKKYLKSTWFNGTGNESVPVEYALWEMRDWDLSTEDLAVMMALVVIWNVGEQEVISVGTEVNDPVHWELLLVMNITLKVFSYGMTAVKGAIGVIYFVSQAAYTGYHIISNIGGIITGVVLNLALSQESVLRTAWDVVSGAVKFVGDTWTSVSQVTQGFFGFLNMVSYFLQWTCVIGLIIGLVGALITIYAIGSSYGWTTLGTYTAVLYGVMMAVYAIGMFVLTLLSFIPKIGIIFTIISTLISLSDLLVLVIFGKGWTTMLMDLIVDLLTDLSVLSRMSVVSDRTEVHISDTDENGLDVGDRISYSQIWDVRTEAPRLTPGLVKTTFLRPTSSIDVPPYSNSETGSDILSAHTWDEGTSNRTTRTMAISWVEPGISMINFPVTILPGVEYSIIYEERFWVFGWQSEWKYSNGSVMSDALTLYFDVMPGSVGDFMRWREVRSSDWDGDGLGNADEPGSDAYSWDADGDGLGDPYERQMNTSAYLADSDYDGLDDRTERVWGTNPRVKDTDGDGLSDYFERAGWVVNFTYCGPEFAWHVYSDGRVNDTDGDGVGDHEEYLTLQNPRSADTDGDGTQDQLRDYLLTTFEQRPTWVLGTNREWSPSIAMGTDGSLYVVKANFDLFGVAIYKYHPDGTLERDWGGSTSFTRVDAVACDPEGYVYVLDRSSGLWKLRPDGTAMYVNYLFGPTLPTTPQDLVVDADGDIYIFDMFWNASSYESDVKVYGSSGYYSHRFGSSGSGPAHFGLSCGLSLDRQGQLHVVDGSNNRIQVFRTNGTYVRTYDGSGPGGNPFSNPVSVSFDRSGDIFVAEGGTRRVQKVDTDGRWIATIDGTDTASGTELEPKDVLVTDDDRIFVADARHFGVLRFVQNVSIVKAAPKPFPDTDGDGLTDAVEQAPWTISVTGPAGTVPLVVTSDPVAPDTDLDGLGDLMERDLGTDPRSPDTDTDGMPDLAEVDDGTDPCHYDTDRDRLPDGTEVGLRCDPRSKDTDGEGVTDFDEFLLHSDPLSNDTDSDGLDDVHEVGFGSDLTDADSDDDCMFDSRESEVGTLPDEKDFDDDGIKDGYEDVYGTDATEGDSDGDLLLDGFEVSMRTDPLSNDTDEDGISDSRELDLGLNPRSGDSDADGVLDSVDGASQLLLEGTVYVAADPGTDTVGFIGDLSRGAEVDITTPEDLLANHTGARYIVLLGDPGATGDATAGGIIRSLLADAPDVLGRMKDPSEGEHIAIRYGRWSSTQTIVMLSSAFMSDHFRVLGILKGVEVKVTDGAMTYTCLDPRPDLRLDGVDVVKATGAAVWAHLDDSTAFSVDIASLTEQDVPDRLTRDSGLGPGELSLGRYLSIEVNGSGPGAPDDIVAGATVWLYYTLGDLDRSGDGDADDAVDIDESALALYALGDATGIWTRLSPALGWVSATGVDTTDLELYGTRYAGVLWANVTHLSLFGVAGRLTNDVPPIARAGPDVMLRTGQEVTFNGTSSTAMGRMANYTWTFQYDGRTVTLYGPAPAFTFEKDGVYRVTLRVTDMWSGTDEDSVDVTVEKEEAKGVAAWTYILVLDIVLLLILTYLYNPRRPPTPSNGEEARQG